jgi:hypothetical protein
MSGLTSKTVFTADVVTYEFLPEKYAEEKALITAELNVIINCDWQSAIDHVCSGNSLADGSASYQLPPSAITVLQMAQDQNWTQDGTEVGTAYTVGSRSHGLMLEADARETVQQFVHAIATKCGPGSANLSYYDGTAFASVFGGKKVNEQFKDVLTALLARTRTFSSETNELSIDQTKVDEDLQLPASSNADKPWLSVPISNLPTTKLSELLSGFAFVPVLNRLVAGGGFSSDTVDGTPGNQSNFHFDVNQASDTTSDLIHNEAHLVFPVRIMFADDGVSGQEGLYNIHQDGLNILYYKKSAEVPVDDNAETGVEVIGSDGDKTRVYNNADGDFSADSTQGAGDSPPPYVKVNSNSYVLQARANSLVNATWSPTVGDSVVSFQLNVIFSNRDMPDAIGTMASA